MKTPHRSKVAAILRVAVSAPSLNAQLVPDGGRPSINGFATNLTEPVANWTILESGPFDWLGNTILTNGIAPDELRRYYSVRQP